jgi:hypothetical protein
VPHGPLDQQRRPARAQHGVGQRSHLQARRHRVPNAAQFAADLELGHEIAQISVFHGD